MKKIAILLIIVALTGCPSTGGGGGGGAAGEITSIGISGADGLARVSGGASGSIVSSATTAELVRFDDGEPTTVEWTAEGGGTVSVAVSAAKIIGDYLFVEYSYDGETCRQMARMSDGVVVDVPSPDNLKETVVLSGVTLGASVASSAGSSVVAYVSSSQIVAVDPSTGSSQVLSGSATVPSGAYLAVNSNLVPFAFTSSEKRGYPDGASPFDLDGTPTAITYYNARNGEASSGVREHSTVYDPATNTQYIIYWGGNQLVEISFNDNGSVNQSETSVTLPIDDARRIGYGQATPENSYFTDGYDNLYKITDLDPLTFDTIALDRNPGQWLDEAVYVDDRFYYKENSVSPTTTCRIRELDPDTGDERIIVTSTVDSLGDWTVIGGALIWTDDSGTWSTDLDTLTTEAYTVSAVEPVTE